MELYMQYILEEAKAYDIEMLESDHNENFLCCKRMEKRLWIFWKFMGMQETL
jgi:hypothetical protein